MWVKRWALTVFLFCFVFFFCYSWNIMVVLVLCSVLIMVRYHWIDILDSRGIYDFLCFISSEPSCVDRCSSEIDPMFPCQCDDNCKARKDCCSDYNILCSGRHLGFYYFLKPALLKYPTTVNNSEIHILLSNLCLFMWHLMREICVTHGRNKKVRNTQNSFTKYGTYENSNACVRWCPFSKFPTVLFTTVTAVYKME